MLDSLTIKQKKIISIIGVIIAIGVIYFIYNGVCKNEQIDLDENILVSENTTKSSDEIGETKEEIVVHITGAIKNPGVVKLTEGARVEDAIQQAGGLTEDADISNVNLAYLLEDGVKIRIPSILDEDSQSDIGEIVVEDNDQNVIIQTDEKSLNKAININKATQADLETLPGIGPSLAIKILEYRESNGKFSDISEIKNVNGIGDSKYENIKDLICVK